MRFGKTLTSVTAVLLLSTTVALGTDIAPGGLAGEIGYLGVTGTTFSDTDTTLSVELQTGWVKPALTK